MVRTLLAIGLALLAATAVAGAPAAASADSGAVDGAGQSDAPDDAEQADNQSPRCDYTALYDQTIESVVAVRTGTGLGSGFAYRVEANGTGYFVTNAHVVGDADRVVVQFAREDSQIGRVVGTDELSDLAVVRVDETPAYVETLPTSNESPEQGQRVAALGNPFGLDETITHGIVSGVNRSMPTTRGYRIPDVVQTDAPISPGNSGGPLVTCEGVVVGVNTAGIAAQGAENLGFAVSGPLVERIAPSIIETGDFQHAYLGVGVTPITPPLAAANDLNTTEGVYVVSTARGSPAADSLRGAERIAAVDGMRVPVGGDVIVGVENRSIETSEELTSYLVTEASPGETVTLTIVRDGERRQVDVTLTERPDPRTTGTTGGPVQPGQPGQPGQVG